MIRSVTELKTTYSDPPSKFEAGTPNIAGTIGLGAALDYIAEIGMDEIVAYEHQLLVHAMAALSGIPGLRLIGTPRDKAPVLSFTIDGIDPPDIGAMLDLMGIAIRTGHHCAQPTMNRFQVSGTTRASLAFYNTTQEIDALVEGLRKVMETLSL